MTYINRSLSLPEIFKRVAAESTIEDKVNLLKRFDRKDMRWVVDFMYNANLDGVYVPEYKPSNFIVGMAYVTFNTAIPKIEAALNNRADPKTYDRNLIIVLEGMHNDEAELLSELLMGKKIEGVSKQVFKRVYPAFFRESDNEATE